MGLFATVAATRIQTWMSRTPRLRLLRGASFALSTATDVDTIRQWIKDRDLTAAMDIPVSANIDGVVPLEILDDADALECVWALVAHLQDALPAVQFDVWIAAGHDYLDAQSRARRRYGDGQGRCHTFTVLPAELIFPVAESCHGCGMEPRTHTIPGHGAKASADPTDRRSPREDLRLGPDCARRWEAAQRELDSENNQLDRVRSAWAFPELAAHGSPDGPPTPAQHHQYNHLATIAADGNRLGALFGRVDRLSAAARNGISEAVGSAITDALGAARERVAPWMDDAPATREKLHPDIRHYIGGDDLLISVPARVAWPYAITVAETFAVRFQEYSTAALSGEDDESRESLTRLIESVGLGIGMAFAHHSHPFSDCVQHATKAQRAAKRGTRGQLGAISWVDLTVENEVPASRYATISELSAQFQRTSGTSEVTQRTLADDLLVRWTGSQLARVRQIVRDQPRDGDHGELVERLTQWSQRSGELLWIDQIAADPREIDLLSDLLNRQRWWNIA